MNVVIISGPSATGKSRLGELYAKKLGYKFISKDKIKEVIFDSQRHNSWDSKWFEKRAKDQFFSEIAASLKDGQSLVAESNYIAPDKPRLEAALKETNKVREIYVTANGMVRFGRFIKRNENGHRHKFHHDRRWYISEFIDGLAGLFGIRIRYKPVRIND